METKQHATKKNQWVTDAIKEEIEKYLETTSQMSMGGSKSSSKREVHSDTGLPQEIRKI